MIPQQAKLLAAGVAYQIEMALMQGAHGRDKANPTALRFQMRDLTA